MSSSRFVSVIAALSILMGIAGAHTAHAAQRNILVIIADDYGIDQAPYYPTSAGRLNTNPLAPPQPNLTALAKKGVLFKSTTAQQECSPTRAEVMTGRYGFRTGIGAYIREGYPVLAMSEFTLAEAFNKAGRGYETSAIGKWHLSYGVLDPNKQGFGYYAGYLGAFGGGALGNYFNWAETINGVKKSQPKYATTEQVDQTIGRIAKAKTDGKPYLIWLGFNTPHIPYHVPPVVLHHEGDLPPFQDGMNPDPYFRAMVESMDTEIGRLLQSVDLSTTTVVFLGDNGTARGDIEQPYNPKHGKSSIYQQGIEVPLLIAGAGVAAPGRVAGGLVNAVDIYPTILELAGISPAAILPPGLKFDGRSFLSSVTGTATPARAWAYSDGFQLSPTDHYERSIRNAAYKYIEFAGGSGHLYNLVADPLEANDLTKQTMNSKEMTQYNVLRSQMHSLISSQ